MFLMMKIGSIIEIERTAARKMNEISKEAFSPIESAFIIRTFIMKQIVVSRDSSMKNLMMISKNIFAFILSAKLLIL